MSILGPIREYHAYGQEAKIMENEQKIHESRYFKLVKDVHRHQHGRGARFQNHRITSYKIVSKYNRWSAAWSPPSQGVTALIKADFSEDNEYPTWKFYNRQAAEKAWVLLGLKYG